MKKISSPVRFGLVTSAVLIAYFLVLALFDKHTNPIFSVLNIIITALGIYEVIYLYKLYDREGFTYYEGFKAGIITGFIATFVFTGFFLFYITEVDTDFILEFQKDLNNAFDITVGLVTFLVAIMGLSTTLICTLTIMQLFKKSRNIL